MRRVLAAACCALVVASVQAAAPSGVPASVTEEHGILTASFDTAEGRVSVRVPAEAAPGDTLSGTVVARAPDGAAPPSGELTGMVVEVRSGDSQGSANPRTRHLTFRAAERAVALLRDATGREVARVPLPVRELAPRPPRAAAPAPDDYRLPDIVQAGHPARLSGPFDGDLRSTAVTLGGEPAPLIAESPGAAFVDVPRSAAGALPLEVTESGVTATGTTHAVGVAVTAPKTTLLAGERTDVRIEVTGLAGLGEESEPQLRIANRTPGVVQLEGGAPARIVPVDPASLAAGRFETSLTLTGVEPGAFTLTVDVTSKNTRCGKPFHAKSFNRLSKGKEGDKYVITYVVHCDAGTCELAAGHEGKCSGPARGCGEHPDETKKETFGSKKERDARFAELSGVKKG